MTEGKESKTMPGEKEKNSDAELVAPSQVRLWRDDRGQLVLQRGEDDEPIEGVRFARCFPWSMPDRHISVRDQEGMEIYFYTSLEDANPKVKQLVYEEFDVQEFYPRITAVHSVDDQFDLMVWDVETDRGPIQLQVKSLEDVRYVDENRAVIKDHAGGLFEVSDLESLDSQSRRLIEDQLG
jgi:hypothetical protein